MAPFHTKAWLLWLCAALTPAVATKNPYYLAVTLAVSGWTYRALAARTAEGGVWGGFLRLGLVLAAVSVAFNVLMAPAGATVLFALPRLRWQVAGPVGPVTLFQLGGAVSLEAVVQGLILALALLTVLVVLAAFNAGADHYQLLRSLPPAFHRSATVLSIALTFIPQLSAAWREIREAQALRGHRFRRLADLPPLFLTLLAEALERSITLAESMEARGFSAAAAPVSGTRPAVAGGVALLLAALAGGSYFPHPAAAWGTAALGLLLIAWALVRLARGARRTRHRRELWSRRDSWVAAASAIVAATFVALWIAGGRLAYAPQPRLAPPACEPWIVALLLLLAIPRGLLARRPGDAAR